MFEVKMDELSFVIGKYKLSTKIYNYDGKHPELSVCLVDDNNVVIQDICLVRHHVLDSDQNTTDNKIDCIVWGDSNSEDYTERVVIDVYDE